MIQTTVLWALHRFGARPLVWPTRPDVPRPNRLRAVRTRTSIVAASQIVLIAVLAPGTAAASPAPTRATAAVAHPNWVLVKATAAEPTEISSPFSVRGHKTGRGPLVLGVGISSQGGPQPFSWVFVERMSGGTPRATVVAGPLGRQLRFDVKFDENGGFHAEPVHLGRIQASTVAVLLFAVNGVIDDVTWDPRAPVRDLRSTVRTGSGARALMVDRPSDGAAVTAGSVGGGQVAYRRQVRTGIVGAVEWLSCEACVGTWTPPAGPTRSWAHVRHHAWAACWCGSGVGMGTVFAGPAGRWSWTWSGVSAPEPTGATSDGVGYYLSRPVAAAYAPIGADWSLFSVCRYSQGCLEADLP